MSEEQEDDLIKLIEEYDDNNQIRAAAYILLENYKMAKRCIDKLEPKSKVLFESFPIYSLMYR